MATPPRIAVDAVTPEDKDHFASPPPSPRVSGNLDVPGQPDDEKEHYAVARKLFDELDDDQNGVLTHGEMKAALTRFGSDDPASMEQIMRVLDPMNRGKISFQDFYDGFFLHMVSGTFTDAEVTDIESDLEHTDVDTLPPNEVSQLVRVLHGRNPSGGGMSMDSRHSMDSLATLDTHTDTDTASNSGSLGKRSSRALTKHMRDRSKNVSKHFSSQEAARLASQRTSDALENMLAAFKKQHLDTSAAGHGDTDQAYSELSALVRKLASSSKYHETRSTKLGEMVKELEDENKRLSDEVDAIKLKLNEKEIQVQNATEQKQQYYQLVKGFESKQPRLESELAEAQEEVKSLEIELEDIRNRSRDLYVENEQLRKDLDMLEEERGDVANPLVRRNTTSTTLMEELKELEEQNEELREEKDQYANAIVNMETEIHEQAGMIESLQEVIKSLQTTVKADRMGTAARQTLSVTPSSLEDMVSAKAIPELQSRLADSEAKRKKSEERIAVLSKALSIEERRSAFQETRVQEMSDALANAHRQIMDLGGEVVRSTKPKPLPRVLSTTNIVIPMTDASTQVDLDIIMAARRARGPQGAGSPLSAVRSPPSSTATTPIQRGRTHRRTHTVASGSHSLGSPLSPVRDNTFFPEKTPTMPLPPSSSNPSPTLAGRNIAPVAQHDDVTPEKAKKVGGFFTPSPARFKKTVIKTEFRRQVAAFSRFLNSLPLVGGDSELLQLGVVPLGVDNMYPAFGTSEQKTSRAMSSAATHGDLFSQLKDGVLLSRLVNVAQEGTIDERAVNKPSPPLFTLLSAKKLENMTLALGACSALGINTKGLGVGPLQMLDCTNPTYQSSILALLWELIRRFFFKNVHPQQHAELMGLIDDSADPDDVSRALNQPDVLLLQWVNHHIGKYDMALRSWEEAKDIEQLSDCSVYMALLHSLTGKPKPSGGASQFQVGSSQRTPMKLKERARVVLQECAKLNVKHFDIVSESDLISGDSKPHMCLLAAMLHAKPALQPLSSPQLERLKSSGVLDATDPADSEELVFRNWINNSGAASVHNLFTDCRDGIVLLKMTDHVMPGSVPWRRVDQKRPLIRFKCNENNKVLLSTLKKKLRLSLVGVGGNDLTEGVRKYVLTVAWQLMRHNFFNILEEAQWRKFGKRHVDEDMIVQWARGKVADGSFPMNKASISSFNDPSLSSGIFFLQLLCALVPHAVDWSAVNRSPILTQKEKRQNAVYAVSVARKIGASVFVLPDDLVACRPKMTMMFLACVMASSERDDLMQVTPVKGK